MAIQSLAAGSGKLGLSERKMAAPRFFVSQNVAWTSPVPMFRSERIIRLVLGLWRRCAEIIEDTDVDLSDRNFYSIELFS